MKRLLSSILLIGLAFAVVPASFADTVRVLMETSKGDITLELDSAKAPKTVENFLRYANEGFYEGTVFHRVINGFMIQGGGYDKDYQRKHVHDPIPNEADNGLKNKRGTIAMARTMNPDSATSQFFINHVDNPALDHTSRDVRGWGYCVFGSVVDGMEVVDAIAEVPTQVRDAGLQNAPEEPIVIERVTVLEAAP